MASVGIRKRVSARTGRVTYQVWWLLDDGSQGAATVSSKEEARNLVARKRLGVTGCLAGAPARPAPVQLVGRTVVGDLGRRSRPQSHYPGHYRESPAALCGPGLARRRSTGSARLTFAVGKPTSPPAPATPPSCSAGHWCCGSCSSRWTKAPSTLIPSARCPRRDVAPIPNRSWTRPSVGPHPEEAGRLLAQFPLFWWDHVLCLLGTGLRFGELAGLPPPPSTSTGLPVLLQVVDTRYQAGRFGSGFKPRPKSDAGIREDSPAPLVVEAIRRQLPPGSDPSSLVFTGPGGGPGRPGGAGVLRAPGPCCRATTSTAPTRPPWPS